MNKINSLLITVAFLLLNVTFIKASVMAIDYGSQWYKVSLITPKIPLELVLNEESQRKTRSIISVIDEVRYFSNDAVSKSTKYPKQTYDFLKLLVGKKINDEEIKFYKSLFDIDIIEDHSRNSILIKSDNETYTVEELISYQLYNAKLIAEKMSGKMVEKAVITVPRFYNQYERLAMVNAAEIAGIKVLSVMNEDTAAAVNFAMTRNFDENPKYYVFFDMGATSTSITLISMKSLYNPEEKSKKSPEVQIHEFNFDKTLGGLSFDKELQLLIVEKIKKKFKNSDSIENDPKIMAKILIKARKAKEILSANTETMVYFDSLINDEDINIKITREEFEKASENLIKRVKNVVDTFFKNIKISKENIDSVILVGGCTRVPMVQNVLKKSIGDNKLANYVNSDEAIVMGAGFHSAHLSQEFKVRTLFIKDIHSSSRISYEYKLSDGKVVSGNLFNEKDPLTKDVTLTLKTLEDFDISINYDKNNKEKQLIFKARISNIKDVIETNAVKEKKVPKVTLQFAISNSDIVFISNASVKAKVPIAHRESLLEKFLRLINKSHWYKNRTVDKYNPSDLPINAPKNFDIVKKQLPLNQIINKYDIYPLTGTVKKVAIERKKAMDKKDGERVEVEVQKNDLESLIYKGREMLTDQEETENKDKIMLSEEEIKNYKNELNELFVNLFENGHVAKISLEEIKNKISIVNKIINLINDRSDSIIKRGQGIKQFNKFIKETRAFYEAMNNIAENKEAAGKQEEPTKEKKISDETTEIFDDDDNFDNNDDDVNNEKSDNKAESAKAETAESKSPSNIEKEISEKIKELCDGAEKWLNEVVEKQSKLKNWDVPAFTNDDIEKKILEIYGYVSKMLEKIRNKESTTSTETANDKNQDSQSTKEDKDTNNNTNTNNNNNNDNTIIDEKDNKSTGENNENKDKNKKIESEKDNKSTEENNENNDKTKNIKEESIENDNEDKNHDEL